MTHEENIFQLLSLHHPPSQNHRGTLIDGWTANDHILIDELHAWKIHFVPYQRNTKP